MILVFTISLFLTLIMVRLNAHLFHDFKAYDEKRWRGKNKDKSKTITGLIRRKIGLDIHHIHLGIIWLIIVIPLILIYKMNNILAVFFAIGLSLVADQIIPYLFIKENYFSRKNLAVSILLHLLIVLVFIWVYR